jgi:site-specific DNA-methyltransferase (adenine-specific)
VKKASEARGGVVVLLIPSRTDTQYFHSYIYKKENVEIRFLKGRLKFGDSKNSAPFPSLLAVFRN